MPLSWPHSWWMLYTRPEEMKSDCNLSVFSLHNLLWFYEIEGLRLTYSHYQRSWLWDDVHYLWRVQRWYGETHKSQMKTRVLVDSICQQALSTFLESLIAMQSIIGPGIKLDFLKMDSFSECFECLCLTSLIPMQVMQVLSLKVGVNVSNSWIITQCHEREKITRSLYSSYRWSAFPNLMRRIEQLYQLPFRIILKDNACFLRSIVLHFD